MWISKKDYEGLVDELIRLEETLKDETRLKNEYRELASQISYTVYERNKTIYEKDKQIKEWAQYSLFVTDMLLGDKEE